LEAFSDARVEQQAVKDTTAAGLDRERHLSPSRERRSSSCVVAEFPENVQNERVRPFAAQPLDRVPRRLSCPRRRAVVCRPCPRSATALAQEARHGLGPAFCSPPEGARADGFRAAVRGITVIHPADRHVCKRDPGRYERWRGR